jgi:alpha-ketoglutarate-dependent taurine dioxygenase
MKLIDLGNAYQIKDIDVYDDEACVQLGKEVADKCVIFLDIKLDEKRLFEIQNLWGQPSRAVVHKYVGEKKLQGSHWRELLINLTHITTAVSKYQTGMTRVSYAKNKQGKPTGLFTNGELDWHSDQQPFDLPQRIIGLSSLFGSTNSKTSFLCTANTYESLNYEDKSLVDELETVWAWDGGKMSPELIPSQMEIVRYHMVPIDGMESKLVNQTASGRKGFKFPSHSFQKFKGMSVKESIKTKEYLWQKLNKPENIYTQNWKDGQTVFMDQNITLHARPTNVKDGDKRTMARMITFLDKLFPDQVESSQVAWNGQYLSHDDFAAVIDEQRRKRYFDETGILV